MYIRVNTKSFCKNGKKAIKKCIVVHGFYVKVYCLLLYEVKQSSHSIEKYWFFFFNFQGLINNCNVYVTMLLFT